MSLEEVGRMTIDQVLMLLSDRERYKKMHTISAKAAAIRAGADGWVKGRAADGTPMKGRITKVSRARQIRLDNLKKKEAEKG